MQFNSAGGDGKRVHATKTQEEEEGSFFPCRASTCPQKLALLLSQHLLDHFLDTSQELGIKKNIMFQTEGVEWKMGRKSFGYIM